MTTHIFYPNTGSGGYDEYCYGTSGISWESYSGYGEVNSVSGARTGIHSGATNWAVTQGTERSVSVFDTSSIGSSEIITSASLDLYISTKQNTFTSNSFDFGLFGAGSGATLFERITNSSTLLSNEITYSSINASAYNTFTLNASGIATINEAGTTLFALCENNYDKGSGSPTFEASKDLLLINSTTETGSNLPKLTVETTSYPPIKINIGDVWKTGELKYINIGDVWKDVIALWINIGDVWKPVV